MESRSDKNKSPRKRKPLIISAIVFFVVIVAALAVYFLNVNTKVDSKIESPSTNKSVNKHSNTSSSNVDTKSSVSSNTKSSSNSNTDKSNNSDGSRIASSSSVVSSTSSIYTGNEDKMLAIHNIREHIASYALSFAEPYAQQFDPDSYALTEIPGGFDIKFTNGDHVVAIDNKNDSYTFTNQNNNQQITQDLGYIMTGKKAPVNN